MTPAEPKPPEPTPDPTGDAEPQPDADGRFAADYVKTLRDENAARRVSERKATERADAMAERLAELTVQQAAAGLLADPEDLLRFVEASTLRGDDGLVDPAKAKAAAEQLAKDKPGLAAKRGAGDIGQGARGGPTPPAPDLADILKGVVR